jgi:hypothetical protein
VISLHAVVAVLLQDLTSARDTFVEHPLIERCPVGRDLDRRRTVRQGAGEARPRGRAVTMCGDQDVDNLAVLIDRAVEVGPAAGDLWRRSHPRTTEYPIPGASGGRRR